jgi:hypothetical protein
MVEPNASARRPNTGISKGVAGNMLTPAGLFWTEIAACFCLAIISGLVAILWTNRVKTGSGSYSSPVAALAPGAFRSIGGVLIAHVIDGTLLTTTGGLPLVVFFLPIAAIVVACGALVACFRTRNSPVRSMLLTFSGAFGAVGVLFFRVLGMIH